MKYERMTKDQLVARCMRLEERVSCQRKEIASLHKLSLDYVSCMSIRMAMSAAANALDLWAFGELRVKLARWLGHGFNMRVRLRSKELRK